MAKFPGSLWVEGNDLHWIDAYNREWYFPGTLQRHQSNAVPGSIWQTQGYIVYVTVNRDIYYIAPYGDAIASKSAKPGSIWVETNNSQLSWITDVAWDANNWYRSRAHADVALVNTHQDTHSDGIHTDTHTDVPASSVHQDVAHTDWHNDVPHSDHTDQSHSDVPHTDDGRQFVDHSDCSSPGQFVHYDSFQNEYWYSMHEDCWATERNNHNDSAVYYSITHSPHTDVIHTDYYTHQDIPHNDVVHQDTHGDSPHQDVASGSSHGDVKHSDAHTDVPHSDVPHQDVPHADAHTDSHGDTPHTDQPILIGP